MEDYSLYASPRRTRDRVRASPLTSAAFDAAQMEICSWPDYRPTPLILLDGLADSLGLEAIWYKDETHRFGLRSFKALGGAYAVLRLLQDIVARRTGSVPTSAQLRGGAFRDLTENLTVTTATDGNHGRAVAWGAQQFHCRCVIFVPRACSPNRQQAIAAFGAEVVRHSGDYDATVARCAATAEELGWIIVSDTSWEGYEETPAVVMQGYGVMMREIASQLPGTRAPTHLFVQAGVGGLAAAVHASASQLWPGSRPKAIVVEPSGAACLYASAVAGAPSPAVGEVHTIMAGLECGHVSPLAWDILADGADFFMTVPDTVVPDCMRLLASRACSTVPIVAGESAVAGLAALLQASGEPRLRFELGLQPDSSILLLGTEGDTDPELYQQLTGMSAEEVRSRRVVRSNMG
jgi:diaminopropionate ammonia-lyase